MINIVGVIFYLLFIIQFHTLYLSIYYAHTSTSSWDRLQQQQTIISMSVINTSNTTTILLLHYYNSSQEIEKKMKQGDWIDPSLVKRNYLQNWGKDKVHGPRTTTGPLLLCWGDILLDSSLRRWPPARRIKERSYGAPPWRQKLQVHSMAG